MCLPRKSIPPGCRGLIGLQELDIVLSIIYSILNLARSLIPLHPPTTPLGASNCRSLWIGCCPSPRTREVSKTSLQPAQVCPVIGHIPTLTVATYQPQHSSTCTLSAPVSPRCFLALQSRLASPCCSATARLQRSSHQTFRIREPETPLLVMSILPETYSVTPR